jgi:transcription termination factor Rho
VFEAVATTENALIRLDAALVAGGVFPPIRPAESGTSAEEQLRNPGELDDVRSLRAELAGLDPVEAARKLAGRLGA